MTDEDKEKKLDARTAYQVAGNLYMQENSVTWARFNAMVATNGIVIAATGLAASTANHLHLLALFLPVFGILLCFVWLAVMWRGFAYLDVWRDSAYRIERAFLAGTTEALYRGDELSRCSQVQIAVEGRRCNPVHRAPPGRARTYATIVILLFGLLYFVGLTQAVAIAPGGARAVVVNTFSAAFGRTQ